MAKKPYTVRLDEEKVIKPIQAIADKENRTAANVIETVLIKFINEKGQAASKSPI